MKNSSLTLFAILTFLFYSNSIAQDKDRIMEKDFSKHELERYKNYFQRREQGINSTQSIDAKYYKLDLKITTSPQYIKGKMTMDAVCRTNNLTVLSLDMMSALYIDSVKVAGIQVSFVQNPSWFDITLDRSYNIDELIHIEVSYQGIPGSSGFGSFEFSSHASVPWVWTLSEPYGAKDWWPCNDHPNDKADSADIIVTCDSIYKVGSNGKLLSVVYNGNQTVTYHWQTHYPISTYLIAIAITNYAQFSNWFKYTPTDSMEVLNYVLPENLASAQSLLPNAVDGLRIFSELFGLYPFINEKFGHAQFGWGGGMEHQTMTYLSSFGEWLVIHELAHEWFGDMITCRTWPDLWLNEGFATYCEVLYNERKYGVGSYWSEMNSIMTSAKNAVGSVYLQDTSSVGNMFAGSRVYNKGGTVLHMLRHVIGDTMFFRSMYNYANDPRFKFGTATTGDFQSVCETTSGKDLNYFFNEWIFGEKYPRYTYGWTSEPSTNGYTVTIGLSQTTGTTNPTFFTMPIDFKIFSAGWDTTVVLFNDQSTQSFAFEVSHHPTSVQLDPAGWILKTKDTLKAFTIFPTSKNFGDVYADSTKTDSVTVYNTGLTTLNISSVVSDNILFTVTPTSASIAPSLGNKFYITFAPVSKDAQIANLTFTHNGPSSPDHIALSGNGIAQSFAVAKGWNMVSIPIVPIDNRKEIVFNTAISSAFRYLNDSGYVVRDSIFHGIGYWLKYNNADRFELNGEWVNSDTIPVETGWNMIGSVSKPIAVNTIGTNPTDMVLSDYFGYDNSYYIADSIKPGKGFWVKTDRPGSLMLNPSSLAKINNTHQDIRGESNKLIFRDNQGKMQELYFTNQGEGNIIGRYDLPPIPPDGSFDVRYASGRMLETFNNGINDEYSILISSAEYPLTISWEIKEQASDEVLRVGEKEISLSSNGSIQILNQKSQIALGKAKITELPKNFLLEQNSPNPFNPSTTIHYQLPVDSRVTLKVFDVLGQEVATLVNEDKKAGRYEVELDGSKLSSGVYFYRLQADGISLIQKMFLAK